MTDSERLRYFLNEKSPDREARIYTAVRNAFAFVLPTAGETCR